MTAPLETWILLGATSSMARALARKLADRGHSLVLAGRDMEDLRATAADARARGAARARRSISMPATRPPSVPSSTAAGSGVINAAVFVGSMPDQADIDADPSLVSGS